MVAKKFGVTREEMDDFSVLSHKRAHEATEGGRFQKEIVPLKGVNKKTGEEVTMTKDEGIRYPSNREKIGKLPLIAGEGGRISAATSSQLSDGGTSMSNLLFLSLFFLFFGGGKGGLFCFSLETHIDMIIYIRSNHNLIT